MKITIDIDDSLEETEVVIRAPKRSEEIVQLSRMLRAKNETCSLLFYKGRTEYRINVGDILFFETNGRQVHAHTTDDVYVVKYRLYELEDMLPSDFIRVSKSAILNVNRIFSLTHSVSNRLIQFQNSYKQIYVSRKYYRELRKRMEEKGKNV
ncbi:response regulator [Liquorilactobacillus sucicola DSM 21376 = JCM 15457]|uniref:Response regulator n=1 Tax=Liquorilactobacillus sucicola DSM 21376 = JCM 15457 TaxID=1423806 RepID=A0A023CXN1_9LACO|nr:LytTR family DNA-binding domain-containing protein [Liquorilactobacillus sucicola]KRN07085.1 response regulator [Liquorilactobacillus sucicola DSM 21376 = JCM 15457]GAJ26579.1 response regulator [Liquorilactobacillus sucicola DSM 21376 = JCM 15457]